MSCHTKVVLLPVAVVLGLFAGTGGASADTCPNAAIREAQGSIALPECRAYEMVSQVDKNTLDTEVWGLHAISPSGNRAIYFLHAAGPGAPSGRPSLYVAARGPAGWATRPIDPMQAPGGFPVPSFEAFSEDLTKGIVLSLRSLTADGPSNGAALYTRTLDGGTDALLTPRGATFSFGEPLVTGAAPDLSSVLYDSNIIPQTDDPVSGPVNVYVRSGPVTNLVGVLPDGSIPTTGSISGSNLKFGSVDNVLSRDGQRAVFHVVPPEDDYNASAGGQIYSREDGVQPETVLVSGSQRTDCAGDPTCGGDNEPDPAPDPVGPLPALYWTAEAQHGDEVLFTSCEKLTDDSFATTTVADDIGQACTEGARLYNGTPTLAGRALYEFNVEDKSLSDLSAAGPGGDKVYGVVGTSEDLDRVYFVAGGVLAPGAVADQPNLYLREGSSTRLIATLDGSPAPSDGARPVIDLDDWAVRTREKTQEVRTSADGRFLLFSSRRQLTGYDNANPAGCPAWHLAGPDGSVGTPDDIHGNSEGRCAELYRYDALTETIVCVSCPASDALPTADVELTEISGAGGGYSRDPLPMNLSPDGSRVIFETSGALTPGDTNGKIDVYQWHDGAISRISSGRSVADTHFVDAEPTGGNILIRTRQRLSQADLDESFDIYDARTGGGFTSPEPPQPPCEGEGCRLPASGSPSTETPATIGFFGPGTAKKRRKAHQPHHRRRGNRVKKHRAHRGQGAHR